MLPCRCKGNRDGFRGDLDQFFDRLDVLDRPGQELFCQFRLRIHLLCIGNRPWGKGDKSLAGHLFPEVFGSERDER